MQYSGQANLELFAENTQIIKKEFIWQASLVKRLAALLYANQGKQVDCQAIRQCHQLILENTGPFSTFRGDLALCIAALLSLSPHPEETFEQTKQVYSLLKQVKFTPSDYLVVAAYQIATQAPIAQQETVVARARKFYEQMKARHFFLTGQDDYVYCAMLGLSDLDVDSGSQQVEELYSQLQPVFGGHNRVQALAQTLALGPPNDQTLGRLFALQDALRAQKIRLDREGSMPALGILALLPTDIDLLVQDLCAIRDALKEKKGFSMWSVETQELLLYAASILAAAQAKDMQDGVLTAALSTSITNILLAQQAAMIAIVAASSAAAASSSS